MRALIDITPTPEQLSIVSRIRTGVEIIRGAAGSGKTTTALLRLKSLIGMFLSRKRREGIESPIKVLVLTYNRTLRGYIENLAKEQVPDSPEIEIEILTFAKWAMNILGDPDIIKKYIRKRKILSLGSGISLPDDFLMDEIEYAMGRFLPDDIGDYLRTKREGRGISPRVDRKMRKAILDDVIQPYQDWIDVKGLWDWNDLSVKLADDVSMPKYDIIVADETQDFSANQIRAINNHLSAVYSLTFIIDTAQRIYARGFIWKEAGVTVRPENSMRLSRNHRNTIEIAQFAAPLIEGIPIDEDATIPDFSKCIRHGPKPIVLMGKFGGQINHVINSIKKLDLNNESVAILHPLGGRWFDETRKRLNQNGLQYVGITRESDWPKGDENIALSTIHSSKGLEFDHIVIVGLNAECMPFEGDDDDDRLIKLRRLLAMGIGRARKSVIIGYKPQQASKVLQYLEPSTFQEIIL